MVRAKKFVLVRQCQGEAKPSDFKIATEELRALKDGEVLVEAEFLSVDPSMRAYMPYIPVGSTMVGLQVGRVTESKSPDWKVGDRLQGDFGWRTHTIYNTKAKPAPNAMPVLQLPDLGGMSPSMALGVLGHTGNSAYFGFLEICQPKKGETVVVSGAAGAVGYVVGQIAKIKGCRVIGFAGTDDKVKWLTEKLGFDAAFNYKTTDLDKALKEAATKGVDCYFDNVGGDISATVLNHMNSRGRISVCGSISVYNADPTNMPKTAIVQPALLFKELVMEGFIASRWMDRWNEGIAQILAWIKEGKLKYEETITTGFDNMPAALIGMLKGENKGKAIVKV